MTIHLQRHQYKEKRDIENISNALYIIEMFIEWSGLKINRSKTYLSIFGKRISCPRYLNTLGIKWCTEFKFPGINFDQTLDLNDDNYEDCFDKVKSELSSWKHRFLTVFL